MLPIEAINVQKRELPIVSKTVSSMPALLKTTNKIGVNKIPPPRPKIPAITPPKMPRINKMKISIKRLLKRVYVGVDNDFSGRKLRKDKRFNKIRKELTTL